MTTPSGGGSECTPKVQTLHPSVASAMLASDEVEGCRLRPAVALVEGIGDEVDRCRLWPAGTGDEVDEARGSLGPG